MQYDGIISRHFNRRLSGPVARVLARGPVTPNLATILALLLALATAGMVAAGWSIAGGIAIQLSSVFGGVSTDLTGVRGGTTRFAEVIDGIAAHFAEAAILAGMTVYAFRFETLPRPEFVGTLALGAALTLGYSQSRIEASLGKKLTAAPPDLVFGGASQDVRLLIAAIGTVAGQCYWTLAVLAAISGLTIAWRLAYLRRIIGAIA